VIEKSEYKPMVPAVDQAAKLLLCLGDAVEGNMTVTQICQTIGIHKSKGYSILHTLMQFNFVIKDNETKAYSLGPGLLPLAKNIHDNLDIKKFADPILQRLAFETQSTVLLGIISNDQFFVIETYETDEIFGVTIRKNQSLHITHGAHGKAIAAFLDKEDLKSLLKQDKLHFYGKNKKFDMAKFEKELSYVRENGFAIDNGNSTPGINALSSPIFDSDKKIIAGIVLLGTFTQDKFDEYGAKVSDMGKDISIICGAKI
jgi:DNA-binding IclR family transcriptional regulator